MASTFSTISRIGIALCLLFAFAAIAWTASLHRDPAASHGIAPDHTSSASSSRLAIHDTRRPGHTLLALHDNENDAVIAARAFVDAHGGRLIEMRADGTRHVTLDADPSPVIFDPNRVFTDTGLRRTLADHGTRVDDASLHATRVFADDVQRAIAFDTAMLLIAVHNNTDGNYAASHYAPGSPLALDAAAVHLPRSADPDDFYLVTTRALYDALVPTGYPVVLQDNARATDDGSLSIHAARRGVAYVNVEAQHGHAAVQRAMLEALHAALAVQPIPPRR